jgi:hypothetical protein
MEEITLPDKCVEVTPVSKININAYTGFSYMNPCYGNMLL